MRRLSVLPSRYGSPAPEVWQGTAAEGVGSHALRLGLRSVMLVTDQGVGSAHASPIQRALEAAGVEVVRYDDVVADPTSVDVSHCAEAARRVEPDGWVALGGGSVMDTAKGAAFVLANGGRMEDWWGFGVAPVPLQPMIAIPTTAGTGSEVQSFALVARASDGAKMACGARTAMPRVALLDPQLLGSAPRSVKLHAGLDAMAHALETAVTTVKTPAVVASAEAAFVGLAEHLPTVLADAAALDAHSEVQQASNAAGQAIEASMLGAAHAAANPLSALYGLPHGLAVALMVPHVLRFNAADADAAATYARLAQRVCGHPAAESLARWWLARMVAYGVSPSLAAHISQVDIDGCVAQAMTQWTGGFNPRRLEASDYAGLYRAACEAEVS